MVSTLLALMQATYLSMLLSNTTLTELVMVP